MSRFLNGATIMRTATVESLKIARETGYAGIEARAERLLEDPPEVATASAAARPSEVWSLNGVRISLRPDGSLDQPLLEADLDRRLEVCRALGAGYLLAVPPRMGGLTEDAALAGIRGGLRIARDGAARIGVRIAFEFLGFFDCPIGTPAAAARAVDGLDDVDLVLDSCHWHASGSRPLDRFPVGRLAMVHLNDAPPKPLDEIEDADRLLPGLGVIRLAELISVLRRRGYDGPWSLETFNPTYWDEDPREIARRGAAAVDALVEAQG